MARHRAAGTSRLRVSRGVAVVTAIVVVIAMLRLKVALRLWPVAFLEQCLELGERLPVLAAAGRALERDELR